MIDRDAGNLLFALSCALDVLVVCGAIGWALRRGEGSLARRLTSGLAAACALLALKAIAMIRAGLGIFGVAHVLWLDFAVVVPLATGALVLGARGRLGRWAWAIAGGGLAVAAIGIYASFVEPARLVTERAAVRLAGERAGRAPVRVGVLSDLQFEHVGEHEHGAVSRLMALRPDVILIAGDLHQGSPAVFARELPAIRALLARLRAPGGVYAVLGDVDTSFEAEQELAGTAVRLLVDDIARTRVRDRALTIAGIELDFSSAGARATARELETAPGARDVRILLAHRPDIVLALPRPARVDLTVAGHTHGGQVQLPGFGPIATITDVPRDVAAGGLHELGGRRIYISRGVGVERRQAPRVRFRAAPEVAVITLR